MPRIKVYIDYCPDCSMDCYRFYEVPPPQLGVEIDDHIYQFLIKHREATKIVENLLQAYFDEIEKAWLNMKNEIIEREEER